MKKRIKLTAEEQEISDAYDRGEFVSVNLNPAQRLKWQQIARNTDISRASQAKDKRINIRIPSRVLEEIQLRAIDEGLPYQTLISSILHKYTTGRLVDQPKKTTPKKTLTQKKRKTV